VELGAREFFGKLSPAETLLRVQRTEARQLDYVSALETGNRKHCIRKRFSPTA
jgi:hypothetical protein